MSETTLRARPREGTITEMKFGVTPITSESEGHVCSNPFCNCDDGPELTVNHTVPGEEDAMAVPWAKLPFCSEDCAEEFSNLGTLIDIEALEKHGVEVRIFPGEI